MIQIFHANATRFEAELSLAGYTLVAQMIGGQSIETDEALELAYSATQNGESDTEIEYVDAGNGRIPVPAARPWISKGLVCSGDKRMGLLVQEAVKEAGGARSTSVGDLVVVWDVRPKCYLVAPIGFKEVSWGDVFDLATRGMIK